MKTLTMAVWMVESCMGHFYFPYAVQYPPFLCKRSNLTVFKDAQGTCLYKRCVSRAPVRCLHRAGVLVLREGRPQQARAAALLLPAPHRLRRGPRPGLAALRPQRALAGALPAHAPGGPQQAQVPAARGSGRRGAPALESAESGVRCLGLHPRSSTRGSWVSFLQPQFDQGRCGDFGLENKWEKACPGPGMASEHSEYSINAYYH